MPGHGEIDDLLLALRQWAVRQRFAHVLRGFKQLRQADIGGVRPADDAASGLGGVVDAGLLGVHVGAVDDGDAWH